MELRHLRYFVAVAEQLSFTKAALRLRVAQPALSRQIAQLEEEAGVKLLERNRRQVALTEAGAVFLVEARSILAQSEHALRAAQAREEAAHQRLNLGYVWGLFHSMVPEIIAGFRREFPLVSVNLFDLTATEQAQALKAGELDAGFIGFADEANALGLSKRKIGQCAFVAVLPEQHPSAARTRLSLKTLAPDFFITISGESYPGALRIVEEACQQAGFRPKILQAAERGHTIIGLVAGGCGVALLPEPLRALPHHGVVFRPLVEAVTGDLFLAWNPEHISKGLTTFLERLETKGKQELTPPRARRKSSGGSL